MTEQFPNLMTKIEVSLTRIEERQSSMSKEIQSLQASVDKQLDAIQREADHRHRNIKTEIAAFVPRREVESMVDAVKTHCDTNRASVLERVSGLEDNQKWVVRSLFALVIGGIPTIVGIIWKMGLIH